MSIEDAKNEVRRVCTTNGTDYFEKKYGKEAEERQSNRTRKWISSLAEKPDEERRRIRLARSHSVEGIMARGHDYETAVQKSNEYYAKRIRYSRIADELWSMIADEIGTNDLYFRGFNYERQFFGKSVDFYDRQSKMVIEFLGDYWHANPLTYKRNYVIYGKSAASIWLADRFRQFLISSHDMVQGVYYVWESEFRNDKEGTAHLISEFILEQRKTRK